MKKAFLITLLGISLSSPLFGRDATCLVHNTGGDPEYLEGVYLTGTGGTRQILKDDVFFACFSPDGRKIAYIPLGTKKLSIMDNNGANKQTLPVETNAHKLNRFY